MNATRTAEFAGVDPRSLRHWLRTALLAVPGGGERGRPFRFNFNTAVQAFAVGFLRSRRVPWRKVRSAIRRLGAYDFEAQTAAVGESALSGRELEAMAAEGAWLVTNQVDGVAVVQTSQEAAKYASPGNPPISIVMLRAHWTAMERGAQASGLPPSLNAATWGGFGFGSRASSAVVGRDVSRVWAGDLDEIARDVLGCARRVHAELGPGMAESAYGLALTEEFRFARLGFVPDWTSDVRYRGRKLEAAISADFLVADKLIVELKVVERIRPLHEAEARNIVRHTGLPVMLINFDVEDVAQGVRTFMSDARQGDGPEKIEPVRRPEESDVP